MYILLINYKDIDTVYDSIYIHIYSMAVAIMQNTTTTWWYSTRIELLYR